MFAVPPDIPTEIFTRMPDEFRIGGQESEWTLQRGSGPMHSFLEGPAFDRAGNFYCVDLAHGRIFRINPAGAWTLFAQYDGQPNGLKIHRDGRIFVADAKLGVLAFDPASGERSLIVDNHRGERFGGLNDLFFADNGELFFTDPGSSSLGQPTGRVFRLSTGGELELLMEGLAYPNGLVLDTPQTTLYVAITAGLSVYRTLLHRGAGQYRWRQFLQLSGGLAGPDGMALDEQGSLAVVHAGFGTVWLFSALGEPIGRIRSCAGIRTTNCTYGGPDRRSLFITEAEDGVILRARLTGPGTDHVFESLKPRRTAATPAQGEDTRMTTQGNAVTRRRVASMIGLAPALASLRAHAADAPVYRIGALLGLTDKGNWNATVMQRGIQMAVDEINGAGGVDGVKLEAAIEDHQGVPRAGVDALQRLRSRYDIPAVLTSYSTVGLAIAPICEQQKIFMLDGGSVTDNLVGKFDYMFHNRSPASVAARAALTIAKDMKFKRMSQLAFSTDDGQSLSRAAEADWTAYGGTISAAETTVVTASNIDTQMAKLRNSDGEFLALWEFSPAPGLALKRAREFGIKVPIIGVEFTAEIARIAGSHAEGYLYASDFFDPKAEDEWPRRFTAAYRAKFGDEPEVYAANYYEGIYIIADLFRRARKAGAGDAITGEQLRTALLANPTEPSVYGGNIIFRKDGVGLKRIGVFAVKDGKGVFQRFAEIAG